MSSPQTRAAELAAAAAREDWDGHRQHCPDCATHRCRPCFRGLELRGQAQEAGQLLELERERDRLPAPGQLTLC